MVIKPGAFIKSINRKPYETCGILLSDQLIDFFTNDHLHRHRHRFLLPIRNMRNELYILFKQCVEFSNNDRLLQQYARLIWTHVDEMIKKQSQSKGSHITFVKAKSYVNKHFQLGINRKVVAAELGLNQDYLNALFHRFSGLNFTQYLLKNWVSSSFYKGVIVAGCLTESGTLIFRYRFALFSSEKRS